MFVYTKYSQMLVKQLKIKRRYGSMKWLQLSIAIVWQIVLWTFIIDSKNNGENVCVGWLVVYSFSAQIAEVDYI